jgi:2-methylcitrate dehydratase PrpD
MMGRIHLEVDRTQSGGSAEPLLVVETSKGVYEHQAVVARGASSNRLSDPETLQKFAELAGTRLATADVDRIADQVLALEDCGDVSAALPQQIVRVAPAPEFSRFDAAHGGVAR